MSLYDLNAVDITGRNRSLAEFRGRVLLIVNTASQCGFTPQLQGLQSLYETYRDRDFAVLGFPCNQFGRQDPGSNEEISQFCQLHYGVTFPMFAKVDVNGPNAHPLFQYLKRQKPGAFGLRSIKWNFTKFLVDRNGRVVRRFAPSVPPERIEQSIRDCL
jgi:glutathione peroxidase